MEQKLNSNSSAGAVADSDMKPIVIPSADIAVNPVLPAALSEGNKLIADFMGVRIGIDNYSWRIGCIEPLQEKHLNYHSSWGWLMPVVEKIEKLHDGIFSFFIVQSECDIAFSTSYKENGDDWDAPNFAQKKGDKLISTWSAVVEFIKWYVSEGSR